MSVPSPERWLPIPGFPDYSLSNTGRVVSYKQPDQLRELSASVDAAGYRSVGLSGSVRNTKHRIHVLVALTFIGPRPLGLEVCHNDGDKLNNCVSNLRYDTRSENQRDRIRHGTHNHHGKPDCVNGHPLSGDNLRINRRTGQRVCRMCNLERSRAFKARRKALAATQT